MRAPQAGAPAASMTSPGMGDYDMPMRQQLPNVQAGRSILSIEGLSNFGLGFARG